MPTDTGRDGEGVRWQIPLIFGVGGLALTLAAVAARWPIPFPGLEFWRWMGLMFAAGFLLRAARRWAYFSGQISAHKAASFDAIFQGAILLNPQLQYPAVEEEFLAGNTGLTPEVLLPWFRLRTASAVSIPLMLAGVTMALAGMRYAASCAIAAAFTWVAYRATISAQPGSVRRFTWAALFGMLAALAEGLLFVQAAHVVSPQAPAWTSFLLYAVLLTGFELSPLPFALGILEAAWFALAWIFPSLVLPSILMPLAYRVARAVPVVLLTGFYLPRYKVSGADLFNPGLASAMLEARQHQYADRVDEAAGGPLLSVVIPAYNEAARLPHYLPGVMEFCEELPGGAEIVVVDDGSVDQTAEYVESIAQTRPVVRLVRQDRNRGKGAAVTRGVAEARGSYVLFADADGATPIAEGTKLLAVARDGADVVIGSRKIKGQDVKRERSWIRSLISSVFYRVTNLLAVPDIADTQCGFKLFRRSAAQRIFPELTETGWAFDVEILFLAQKYGMIIREVAVNWTAVEGSKLKTGDGFKFLMALLRIRRRASGLTGSRS